MNIKVIINGDDLGLTPCVNQAVEQAFRQGILTSTTLLATGEAFSQALEMIERNPGLGVGAHLALVGQKPVLPPDQVPSLVDENGWFYPSTIQFAAALIRGKIILEEIKMELCAQVEKTLTAGVSITHLDSHQHLHMLPLVADQVAAIGIKYGINKIRKPLDPHTLSLRINRRRLMMANLYLLSWLHFRRPTFSSFKTTDYCLGIIDSGNINSQRLLDYLKKMRPGWYEIVFHPCTDNLQFNRYTDDNYDCQGELNALLDPAFKDICRQKNVELVNFSHLGLA